MLRKLLFLLAGIIFFANTIAMAKTEQIDQFSSYIVVNLDASIDVTENISVYANNDKIIHGLVRYLPLRYTDSYGINRHTQYDIIQILVNGRQSAYHTKRADNQLAIYIGDKHTILNPGNYLYTISYHVNNAVNFLRNGDEIYWNITGNGWIFPIESVQATIQLPAQASILNYHGYTGFKGEKGGDFNISGFTGNQIVFASTKVLQPGEGLTVAVAWQKGIVQQPSWWQWFVQQFHSIEFLMMEITLVIFIYYFYVWYLYGRGPAAKTIVPLFEPPENLTPEAMRYIYRMGYDAKTFSSAIVNMAANGYLMIENEDSRFALHKIKENMEALPEEEKILARTLFLGSNALIVSKTNYETFRTARSAFKNILSENYQEKYFVTNRIFFVPALLMTALAFAVSILFSDDVGNAAFAVMWLSVWTFGCSSLLILAFNAIQLARSARSFSTITTAIFSTLFVLPFLAGEAAGIVALNNAIPLLTIPMLFLMVVLNIVFFFIMKAPTEEGRALTDKIEGFKLFFTTTERYRIEKMYPGKKAPEIFEKYLPYAIALDVESEWTEQFNEILRNAGMDPDKYHPTWYESSSSSSRNIMNMPVLLGAGLASSLASASTSSSASGGGGSSGGGGGGGGGGGW